jgi:hypothetical protein
MANTKKIIDTTTENTEQNVETQETKIETKDTTSIDIESIIKKAVSETAKNYDDKITDYENKIKELEARCNNNSNNGSKFDPNKRIKIMYMGAGSANFSRGRINVDFKQLFDTHDVRYDIFEEMYDIFGDWFRSFELIILNKDVREETGLEYGFNTSGADKTIFFEMLKLDNAECLNKLSEFSPQVAMGFLKFYVDEYLKYNSDAIAKFSDITTYFQNHFGIGQIQNTIQEMMSGR